MNKQAKVRLFAPMVLTAILPFCAKTGAASFTGDFVKDNDFQAFNFTVDPGFTDVTLRTFSYAGGVNGAGTVIPRGGFDTVLSLADGTGTFAEVNDDGGSGNVSDDVVTGGAWDSFIHVVLAPGDYTLYLTQSSNTPTGATVAEGFAFDAESDFTHNLQGQPGGFFWDAHSVQRDSHWAVDIVASATPTVPETGNPILLTSLAAAGVFGFRRKIQ